MNTVSIGKAQGIGDKKVEAVKILIVVEVPDYPSLEKAANCYQEDASTLADVLCDTLPGGTLDRLIAELLTRKATCFKVPLFNK